jgi:hypothetical protein
MPMYLVVRPIFRRRSSAEFAVEWEGVCGIAAPTALEALRIAKEGGNPIPVIMPHPPEGVNVY